MSFGGGGGGGEESSEGDTFSSERAREAETLKFSSGSRLSSLSARNFYIRKFLARKLSASPARARGKRNCFKLQSQWQHSAGWLAWLAGRAEPGRRPPMTSPADATEREGERERGRRVVFSVAYKIHCNGDHDGTTTHAACLPGCSRMGWERGGVGTEGRTNGA